MSGYRIGIEPEHDSENEFSSEDIVFEFDRTTYGIPEAQMTITIPQPGYRAYARVITLRGEGLRALYYGLKRMFDPSADEID